MQDVAHRSQRLSTWLVSLAYGWLRSCSSASELRRSTRCRASPLTSVILRMRTGDSIWPRNALLSSFHP